MSANEPISTLNAGELEALLNSTADVIVRFDRRYRHTYANQSFLMLAGRTAADVLGKTLREVSRTPELAAFWEERVQRVFDTGAPESLEFESPTSGRARWFEARFVPQRRGDGAVDAVIAIARDITERRSVESRLVARQALLRDIVDNASDLILTVDLDDRIVYANNAWYQALGYSVIEAMELTVCDVLALPSHDDWRAYRSAAVCLGETVRDARLTLLARGGAEVLVRGVIDGRFESGAPAGARCFLRNVTDQERIEAELRESQARFTKAFDEAAIGMAIVGLDGRFLQVNRCLAEMLGYTREEFQTLTFQEITHADDLAADLEFVRQMSTGELTTYQMEKRYLARDGGIIWILLSVSLVRNEQGQPLYFISQIQDITRRKELEAHLTLLAYHDPLTGLPNRVMALDLLSLATARARRHDTLLALIYIDLDEFKKVNDSFGHSAGDDALRLVADCMRTVLRETDTAAPGR